MGIPGEDLPGQLGGHRVRGLVQRPSRTTATSSSTSPCERAVVIGNGNVAADVARMLALTRDELAATDVADHALEVLAASAIREIVVLGRRGPAQAAFTNPELLELGEMTDADVFVDARDVAARPAQPGLHRERGREHHGAQERGDPHRLRRPRGRRQAPPDRPALPRLPGGDPRRRAGDRHPDLPQRAGRRRATGPCAPGPPRSSRRSTAGSCSARSAIAACRWRTCPSTSARGVIPNERGRVSRRRARRCPAST